MDGEGHRGWPWGGVGLCYLSLIVSLTTQGSMAAWLSCTEYLVCRRCQMHTCELMNELKCRDVSKGASQAVLASTLLSLWTHVCFPSTLLPLPPVLRVLDSPIWPLQTFVQEGPGEGPTEVGLGSAGICSTLEVGFPELEHLPG